MANTIIIKNGAGAPPNNALTVAELGFDTQNKKLYIGDTLETNLLINPLSVNLEGTSGEITNPSKPQSPLQYEDKYFYPLTTVDQVITDNNARLNVLLNNLETSIDTKQEKYKPISISLSSSNWSNMEQTVSANGVTADNTIILSPAPASHVAYGEAGIYCSAQGENTLTFTCSETPSTDLTVNVLIMN